LLERKHQTYIIHLLADRKFVTLSSHSVVQSTFDDPCSLLPGGFSSGAAGDRNVSAPSQVWDLRVTNVTQRESVISELVHAALKHWVLTAIWFYCANIFPVFHCTAGMVG